MTRYSLTSRGAPRRVGTVPASASALSLAAALGWPCVQVGSAACVGPGEAAWLQFVMLARRAWLEHALAALEQVGVPHRASPSSPAAETKAARGSALGPPSPHNAAQRPSRDPPIVE